MNKSLIIKLGVLLLICLGIGYTGSIVTLPAIPDWYSTLNKSPLTPPDWLFGPVWTTLYILMAIAGALIWNLKEQTTERKKGLWFFGIQLGLNFLWSQLFFGLKNPEIAFIDLILLLISILMTIYYFRMLNKWAAWLLIPYALWVSYAGYLNLSIAILN